MFCKKMQLKMEILDIQDAGEAAPTPPPPHPLPLRYMILIAIEV